MPKKKTYKKVDIYDRITNMVIDGLKEKGLEWFKPWTNSDGTTNYPVNHITGYAYQNMINLWVTTAEALDKGYAYNEWLTMGQIIKQEYKLKKSQKATHLVGWYLKVKDKEQNKWLTMGEFKKLTSKLKLSSEDLDDRFEKRFFPTSTPMFNIGQLEGDIQPKFQIKDTTTEDVTFKPLDKAEDVVKNMRKKPSLDHGGNKAYYQPSTHHVQMPKRASFKTKNKFGQGKEDDYYKVLFHELIHSTGNAQILNRKTLVSYAPFGSDTYSQEELVAEMGTMFLCATLGLEPTNHRKNSQAYINGWISHLKNHKKELLYASSQAQKAVKYILGEDK